MVQRVSTYDILLHNKNCVTNDIHTERKEMGDKYGRDGREKKVSMNVSTAPYFV